MKKSTQDAATLTNEIWKGVLAYLNGAPFSSLVARSHRQSAPELSRA